MAAPRTAPTLALLLAVFGGALPGARRLAARRSAPKPARSPRRRTVTAPLALAVAALATFAPRVALAYKCSRVGADVGPSLFWQERTIPWWANAAVSDDLADKAAALEQVKLGFQAWQDVDCSDLEVPFQGAEPNLVAGFSNDGNNKNVVVFVEAGWMYDAGAIAVTTNAFDTRTGRILDSDIEVNGVHFQFTIADASCDPKSGRVDVRNTITHEAGHVFGLDHPPNTARYADTTMFASAPPCETKKRTLAQDDIDGLCAIYPTGQPVHQCYPPDEASIMQVSSSDGFGGGGCTAGGRGQGGLSGPALLLGALGLVRALRRARRG